MKFLISQDSYLALLERSEGGLIHSIIISQIWLMCSFSLAADVGYDYLCIHPK